MSSTFPRIILLISGILLSLTSVSQDWKTLETDELFLQAREEAFHGNRKKAREMLQHILLSHPEYADVRILLGRTYAWEARYNLAESELVLVLAQHPANEDAFNALIDSHTWSGAHEKALITENQALAVFPDNETFLFKKAGTHNALEEYDEALITINKVLESHPENEKAIALRDTIRANKSKYTLTWRTGVDLFSRSYDPAFYTSLALGRKNNWGTSIVRLNYSRRFHTSGLQGEVDLYPKIVRGVYGYLNYGYSKSGLFPRHRTGAEVFTKLPWSFEASAGFRYLYFSSDNTILMYTGSIGYYYRNLWFSLRPYITPNKKAGTAVSLALTVRKYFENSDTYIGTVAGFGYSPDIRVIQTGENFTTQEIFTLRSQRVGIVGQKRFRPRLYGSLSVDLVHQELSYQLGNYVWITSVIGTINYRF